MLQIFLKDDYKYTYGEESIKYMSLEEGYKWLIEYAYEFWNHNETELSYEAFRVAIREFKKLRSKEWENFAIVADYFGRMDERDEALMRSKDDAYLLDLSLTINDEIS